MSLRGAGHVTVHSCSRNLRWQGRRKGHKVCLGRRSQFHSYAGQALALRSLRQRRRQSHQQSFGLEGLCWPGKACHGRPRHGKQPLGCEHPGDRQRGAGCHACFTPVGAQSWRQAEGLDGQRGRAGGCGEKGRCLGQAPFPGRGRGLGLPQTTQMAAHGELGGAQSRGPGGGRGSWGLHSHRRGGNKGQGLQDGGSPVLSRGPGARSETRTGRCRGSGPGERGLGDGRPCGWGGRGGQWQGGLEDHRRGDQQLAG